MDYISMFNPSHPLAIAQPTIPFDPKSNTPGPVYLRQHRTIELIELIEVPPPTTLPHQPSTITSSEASSSSSSSYSDSYDSSEFDSDEDEDAGSSYCSSDEEDMAQRDMPFYDDTYRTRLGRVLAWRDSFITNHSSKELSPANSQFPFFSIPICATHFPDLCQSSSFFPFSSSLLPRLSFSPKAQSRPANRRRRGISLSSFIHPHSLLTSRHFLLQKYLSSKRSRSIPPPEHRNKPWPHRRLSAHSCSACDACFTTRQSLRQHAHDLQPTDPCRLAVEYDFES